MPVVTAPAGLFVSQKFADPRKPPGILADAIDPKTGEYLSISKGMDPIDSQVIVALTVVRASGSAVTDDGQTFSEIRKIDGSTGTLIGSRAKLALKRLTENRDIGIQQLASQANPDDESAALALQYKNLRALGPTQRSFLVIR